MSGTTQSYKYSNETFSGCDMVATINMKINSNGKETMISKTIGELQTVSYSIHMEKSPVVSIGNVNVKDYTMGRRTIAGSLVFSVFNFHFAKTILNDVNSSYAGSGNLLVDELPPFDLTISAANEYGYRSKMVIYGIRLLNEGQVMSINDVYTENTYQFFATDIEYLNDEAKYVYDNERKMFTITETDDIYVDWLEEYEEFSANGKKILNKDFENHKKDMQKKVEIQTMIKQPTLNNSNGIVTFILSNLNKDTKGNVIIKGNGKIYNLASGRKISKELPPGNYSSSFESSSEPFKNSNKHNFKVIQYSQNTNLSRFSPVAERFTNSSISLIINDPSHDTVEAITEDGEVKKAEVIKKRAILKNLNENTIYQITSFNSSDNNRSVPKSIKTLSSSDVLFERFEKYIYGNSTLMAFKDINKYKEIIDKAKVISNNNDTTLSSSFMIIKKQYQIEDNTSINVSLCSELIAMSLRFENSILQSANEINLPMPELFYNKSYETCFRFEKEVESFDIYEEMEGKIKFIENVNCKNLTQIESKNNCYRFLGKAGNAYSITCLSKKAKSQKLKFLVYSESEKISLINKNKDTVSEEEKEYLKNVIQDTTNYNLSTSELERALVCRYKTISNPIFMPPSIDVINKDIIVKTTINLIQNTAIKNSYNIAIASIDDVFNDEFINRVSFSNIDTEVIIDKEFNNLKDNTSYVLWIEDNNYVQISNATSLIYGKEYSQIKEIENTEMIDNILNAAKNNLNSECYEGINALAKYNSTVSYSNLISEILNLESINRSPESEVINFIKEIKEYIGPSALEDKYIIENIKFDGSEVSFTSNEKGSIYIANRRENAELLESNKVKLRKKERIFIVAVLDDLTYKSKIIMAIEDRNKMEVI